MKIDHKDFYGGQHDGEVWWLNVDNLDGGDDTNSNDKSKVSDDDDIINPVKIASTRHISLAFLTTMILILRFDTICAFISISIDDIIKISTLTTIDESIDALKAIASSSEPTKLISIHQRVKALMLNGHNQLIHLHPGERVAH